MFIKWIYLILTTILGGINHFTNVKTEAQRSHDLLAVMRLVSGTVKITIVMTAIIIITF